MSFVDVPAERMVAQVAEFAETERRFRRYRWMLVALFVFLILALLVYLLLTWQLSEETDEPDEYHERDSMTFSTILAISVCTLAAVSVGSFVVLEVIRRRTIRLLVERQNAEMRSYFVDGESLYGTNQINPSAPPPSDHSSWMYYPPGSEASSPPPAYEDCVEGRQLP